MIETAIALHRDHLDDPLEVLRRLGEASGAAMAAGTIKAALACHRGMATFAEAGVTDKE